MITEQDISNMAVALSGINGLHSHLGWLVRHKDLNLKNPATLVFLATLGSDGARDLHTRYRRALKQKGFEFRPEPTGLTIACRSCLGTGELNKYTYKNGNYETIKTACKKCKGSGHIPETRYSVYFEGNLILNNGREHDDDY